jgi:hypothetical protein
VLLLLPPLLPPPPLPPPQTAAAAVKPPTPSNPGVSSQHTAARGACGRTQCWWLTHAVTHPCIRTARCRNRRNPPSRP